MVMGSGELRSESPMMLRLDLAARTVTWLRKIDMVVTMFGVGSSATHFPWSVPLQMKSPGLLLELYAHFLTFARPIYGRKDNIGLTRMHGSANSSQAQLGCNIRVVGPKENTFAATKTFPSRSALKFNLDSGNVSDPYQRVIRITRRSPRCSQAQTS